MKTRIVLPLAACVFFLSQSVSAQSRDPYFSTFSAHYDVVYHEPGATSNAGAHFDVASTLKRDVPFIGPVGEVGFNHFDGGTVVSVMGGLRVRANTDYWVLPYGAVHSRVGSLRCLRQQRLRAPGRRRCGFPDGKPERQNPRPVRPPTCIRGERLQCRSTLGRHCVAVEQMIECCGAEVSNIKTDSRVRA